MKKVLKIIGIILVIFIIMVLILIGVDYFRVRNGERPILEFMSPTIKAVVIEVDEKSMVVMAIEGESGLLFSGFGENGNIGFKQGQEILIYYDGYIMETYPGQISNVEKIKILKEESGVEIPIEYLKYCYSSEYNVNVTVNEFTNTGMELSIVDTNEIPYEYTTSYEIDKKVKNENYTGEIKTSGEATGNSIPPMFSTGSEYIWKQLDKKVNMESEDTAEPLTYNLPSMTENDHYTVVGWKFDWTELYGELDEGEYTFILSTKDSLYIKINFEIDDKGKIEYEIESPRKDNSDKYTTKVTDDGSGIIVVENILKDNANTIENNVIDEK